MSATGIGFRATAAPVASAKFQIRRLAASSRMRTLRATISACRSPAIKQRIQGDQGFSLALEHVEDASLERLDQGRGPFPLDLGRAVGELDLDLVGVGPGGRHDDVVGTDQVFDPLVLDLGVDLVAVDLGIAVDLVEDEDDRLLGLAQLGQGFDLPCAACRRRRRRGSGRRGGRRRGPGPRGPRRRPRRCPAYRPRRAWLLRGRAGRARRAASAGRPGRPSCRASRRPGRRPGP